MLERHSNTHPYLMKKTLLHAVALTLYLRALSSGQLLPDTSYSFVGFGTTEGGKLWGLTEDYTSRVLISDSLGVDVANHVATDSDRNRIIYRAPDSSTLYAYNLENSTVSQIGNTSFSPMETNGGGTFYQGKYYLWNDANGASNTSAAGLYSYTFDANGNIDSQTHELATSITGELGDIVINNQGELFILNNLGIDLYYAGTVGNFIQPREIGSVSSSVLYPTNQMFIDPEGRMLTPTSGGRYYPPGYLRIVPPTGYSTNFIPSSGEGSIGNPIGSMGHDDWVDLSDGLRFKTASVPEVSTFLLLGLGSVFLIFKR